MNLLTPTSRIKSLNEIKIRVSTDKKEKIKKFVEYLNKTSLGLNMNMSSNLLWSFEIVSSMIFNSDLEIQLKKDGKVSVLTTTLKKRGKKK